tara:strand:+ start:863 stop:1132 length:270 start_codon:yes stop_codon:yes gene_type:complete
MCPPSRPKAPPPPAPIPQAPPAVQTPPPAIVESKATTTRKAPREARPTTASAPKKTGEPIVKKKKGRGSLRIPLLSSGLSSSGLNFPSP